MEDNWEQDAIRWLDQYYPDNTDEPNLEDVDTAFKLCLYCMMNHDEEFYIVTTLMGGGRMFWWVPMCPGWSQKKGKDYGPGPLCPYSLESVFSKRRFVFPCFEDLKHIFWLALRGKIEISENRGKYNSGTFRKSRGHNIKLSMLSLTVLVERTALKKKRPLEIPNE